MPSKKWALGAKVAQYDVEASVPKEAGGVSDSIMQEAIRRLKNIKRVSE